MNEGTTTEQSTKKVQHQNNPPARPKPAFGAFVIGILKYLHPSVKVCYGCGQTLKPNDTIPAAPHDLVVVSGCKRSFYDTQNKQVRTSNEVTNAYFHLNPNCVSVHHPFFIPGLIAVPDDIVPHLTDGHKQLLKDITGVTVV